MHDRAVEPVSDYTRVPHTAKVGVRVRRQGEKTDRQDGLFRCFSYEKGTFGAGEGIRTLDLLLGKQTLYR